jgi:hypothetical protein
MMILRNWKKLLLFKKEHQGGLLAVFGYFLVGLSVE